MFSQTQEKKRKIKSTKLEVERVQQTLQKYNVCKEITSSPYANKMNNLEEMNKFLEMHNFPRTRKKQKILTDQSEVMKLKL